MEKAEVKGGLGMTKQAIYYPSEVFPGLAAAEATHWWFRARNKILKWAFSKFAGNCRDFLEIGCGTGFVLEGFSHAFPQLRLSGSEYFEEGLSFAKQRVPSADFRQIDATKMDDFELYDCIGAFDVIEHIEEDVVVLQNIHRALRSGGYLMLTVPQHRWLWSIVDEHSHHCRRYTRKDLVEKIRHAHFEPVFVSSFVSLLVPLMWLNRRKTELKADFDLLAEFHIPRWLNASLEWVMGIEFFLMRIGVRFPIGGSLLVVARKI